MNCMIYVNESARLLLRCLEVRHANIDLRLWKTTRSVVIASSPLLFVAFYPLSASCLGQIFAELGAVGIQARPTQGRAWKMVEANGSS